MSSWNESLSDYKMNATTTEFLALMLSEKLDLETRERLLPSLFEVGDYEMEFLYSYTVHLIDILAEIDEKSTDENPQELDVEDVIKYSLQHMGIDGHIK